MRLKKMLRLLKEATEKNSKIYTQAELDYMNHQLEVIEGEIKRLEHRDYKGFGKKYEKSS
jgi:spore cortex formation protein SpoVR/YcgB (stage V sporulation)